MRLVRCFTLSAGSNTSSAEQVSTYAHDKHGRFKVSSFGSPARINGGVVTEREWKHSVFRWHPMAGWVFIVEVREDQWSLVECPEDAVDLAMEMVGMKEGP